MIQRSGLQDEKILHVNSNQKRPGMDTVLSDKIKYVIKGYKRQRTLYIGKTFFQQDVTIIYTTNKRAPKYMKQKLPKLK